MGFEVKLSKRLLDIWDSITDFFDDEEQAVILYELEEIQREAKLRWILAGSGGLVIGFALGAAIF